MTLLFMDSGYGQALGKYSGSPTMTSHGVDGAFPGGYSRGSNSIGTQLARTTFAAVSEVIANARIVTSAASGAVSFWGDAGATQHLSVFRNDSGRIEVRRGTTAGTLLATGTTVIPNNVAFHMQVRATINDTTGRVRVRLNGLTANEIDFTGDTKNAGTNSTIDAFELSGTNATSFSDIVVLNTAGSVNNDWLGDVIIRVLLPSANGASSQGVNSAGNSINNYTYTDETSPSSSNYVGITTNGQGDSYVFTDLPAGATTVLGVQQVIYSAKSDAGAKSVSIRTRISGTNYAGPPKTLSTTYQTFADLSEVSPATGVAWTASEVTGAEFGAEAAA